MKKIISVAIILGIMGLLAFIIYHEVAHEEHLWYSSLLDYASHILVCVIICEIFHNPMHKITGYIKDSFR